MVERLSIEAIGLYQDAFSRCIQCDTMMMLYNNLFIVMVLVMLQVIQCDTMMLYNNIL